MNRAVPFLLLFGMACAAPVHAQEGIPAETLTAIKRATVFVQTSGGTWKSTGTGFIVEVQKDSILIATNHHVVASPERDRKKRPTASDLVRSFKQVTVSVVFDPGTKGESSAKAEIIAADPDTDLAILRVARPKDPPTPIDFSAAPKPTETMPVYVFGFPFGQALATSKGAPAITVGKGSVSSLRLDEAGDLSIVQIDGALNPGNSGGPVVDSKGKLIGIAVATLRTAQGIGFAIPAAELVQVMKGRLGAIHYAVNSGAGKINIRFEVEVVDPKAAVRGVTLRYLQVAPNGAKPATGDSLDTKTGSKSISLKVADGVATGEVVLDANGGEIYVQAVPEGGAGAKGSTHTQPVNLTGQKGRPVEDSSPFAKDPNARPPFGWKEYTPFDRAYSIWIPSTSRPQRDLERTLTIQNQQVKSNILSVEMANGMAYIAQVVFLENASTQESRAGLEDAIRELLTSDTRGRITSESDIKSGSIPGKEIRIESGRTVSRSRILIAGNWIMVLQTTGTRELVDSDAAQTFFTSCRITADARPGIPQPNSGFPTLPKMPSQPQFPTGPNAGPWGAGLIPRDQVPLGRRSKVQGGERDPEFSDESKTGGLLVGAEIGLGKFINSAIVSSIRPIYRIADQDLEGAWHGPTHGKQIVRAFAKPGYAVGAITVNSGIGVDGVSFTYMRVVQGRLDPEDSYESPWYGGPGGFGRVKVGGTGTHSVGLIIKAKNEGVTGLGLIYPESVLQPPAQFPAGNPGAPVPEWANRPQSPEPGPNFNPPSQPQFENGSFEKRPPPPATPAPEESKRSVLWIVLGVLFVSLTLLTVTILGAYFLTRNAMTGRSPRGREFDDDDDERPRNRGRR